MVESHFGPISIDTLKVVGFGYMSRDSIPPVNKVHRGRNGISSDTFPSKKRFRVQNLKSSGAHSKTWWIKCSGYFRNPVADVGTEGI